MKYQMNTDGGARGNPGPSAIGVVIRNEKKEKIFELGTYIGKATNNQAEYAALIEGLKAALERKISHLDCRLDSELIVKQLKGEYRVKNIDLKTLWLTARELASRFKEIEFSHVLRENNQDADLLVNKALDAYQDSPKGF
ncbi:hypothetical protein A2380_03005 [candidate division WWE3 bacterium RIFOXYB1_FULL_43_24]|uniref:Ribonuclease H n=1 Tax=candidate division WWE3 bacterium GW2011_GWF1_42_14 TaxID=1619138 RepID=A0A0G0YLS5_UNCKA|nr:MAG: Ribonuclease H [candidate division WWE3 bacterium GW2011_GWA1_42_12]KKS37579.1 MAG: Ribonuclease H [candidate division WWE3 bacterium GW2011_GWF1_42_14]OGC58725.1 MAG: hypothetical protein A2212_00580 [candidate division WWE3 bacterium RIFOXYA1_FULL_42_9]OGC69064.1 MAG: hypothetical protein A2380_03005 [candidate division WWE3 bacterium RIFOXYB1_FULL_43_24]OGC72240.1 MAG: hypothetical protein A2414_01640 [candidate division WWE3 bacterium RIFOXYC1_FULL_42_13]